MCPAKAEDGGGTRSTSDLVFQLLKGVLQGFWDRPCLPDGGHKIRVAVPAGKHVHMKMSRDAGTGGSSKVHPEIDAVGEVDFTQGGLASFGEVHHLVADFL